MNKCDQNCNTCASNCNNGCPICNVKGKVVPLITVKSLIKDKNSFLTDDKCYICINRKCPVIYYQEGNPRYFINNDIKTQIWFKSRLNEQIICYCHNIKLTDIVNIVKQSNDNELTKEKIFKELGLELTNKECIYHNPLGESCDKLFDNAIEFAYKQKNNS